MPESLVQMFFCEFCEIFKNTFFYRTPPLAVSVLWVILNLEIVEGSNKLFTFVKS